MYRYHGAGLDWGGAQMMIAVYACIHEHAYAAGLDGRLWSRDWTLSQDDVLAEIQRFVEVLSFSSRRRVEESEH